MERVGMTIALIAGPALVALAMGAFVGFAAQRQFRGRPIRKPRGAAPAASAVIQSGPQ
jgi:hypothetical protein